MQPATCEKSPLEQVGRYAIFDELAAGGMGRVHLARLVGSAGFSRVVAVKRMHRHLLQEPEFQQMFLGEARVAARIVHPNVVSVLDVIANVGEFIIVMEYVHGGSLQALIDATKAAKKVGATSIGCAIIAAVLHGLHAAHEACDEQGRPLGIVHRDVSPHNILVGVDGVARVLDFGIAKALHANHHSDSGTLRGKFAYMAPEVIRGSAVTRQADVFSAGIVLWELLAGRKLIDGATNHERMHQILRGDYPSPRTSNPKVQPALERIVARALSLNEGSRYPTALEFAIELERVIAPAPQRMIGDWVKQTIPDVLEKRAALIQAIETTTAIVPRPSIKSPLDAITTHAPAMVERPQSPSDHETGTRDVGTRPPARRRFPVWVTLATFAGVNAALLFTLHTRPLSSSSSALQTGIKQAPEAVTQNVAPAAPIIAAPPSSASVSSAATGQAVTPEKGRQRQPSSKSAVPGVVPQARTSRHGNRYLPTGL